MRDRALRVMNNDIAARLAQARALVAEGKVSLPATARPENFPGQPGPHEVTAIEVHVYPNDERPRSIVIRYGIRGYGFGEVTIYADVVQGLPTLRVDTEYSSKEIVAMALVAAAPQLGALLVGIDHANDR